MAEVRSQIKVTEYQQFGGDFMDSVMHSAMFRDDNPYEFGVMTSRLFSAANDMSLTNKKWNYLTEGNGNYFVLPAGRNEYTWSVVGDADISFVVTKLLVGASSYPGKNKQTFEIGINVPYLRPGIVIKSESDNAPHLEIISYSSLLGTDSYKYTVKLQDGNVNAWLPVQYLQPGQRFTRSFTRLTNEENVEYGNDNYSSQQKLRGVVGQVGNTVTFTDRFLKMELSAANKGKSNTGSYQDADGKSYRDAFSKGYIYQANLKDRSSNKRIEKGFVIPAAEARLLERTERDAEMMMEFGRFQVDNSIISNRVKKTAPGWRQLVRDGQYMPHGGNFTLQDLYDFLHQVFFRRRNFKNREPYLVGGTGAITYLSTLLAAQAPTFQTVEPGFTVRDNSKPIGVHKYEKEWGFQFTRFLAPQGIEVAIMYDPSKDDDTIFQQEAPGSQLPLESFQIDILEFGKTENKAENATGQNITMVKEDMSDYFFSVSNAIDWKKGIMKSGENVYRFGKNVEMYREKSCGLAIWDVSAIGRIEWIPGYAG